MKRYTKEEIERINREQGRCEILRRAASNLQNLHQIHFQVTEGAGDYGGHKIYATVSYSASIADAEFLAERLNNAIFGVIESYRGCITQQLESLLKEIKEDQSK